MNEQSIPYVETHIITTEDLKYAYYRGKHDMPEEKNCVIAIEQRKGEKLYTRVYKDFLLYLIELAAESKYDNSDECTLTYESEEDGLVFKCKMNFEIYKKDGE